jgi:hypothetical protein
MSLPLFPIVTHNGNSIALLLALPNMGSGLSLSYTVGTSLDEGLSGRESRRPRHEALRLEQSFTLLLEAGTADEWRKMLPNLGTAYVGVPVWCDYLNGAQWADRIHSAQFLVRFSNNSIIAAGSTLEAAEYYAPLLVGRLEDKPSGEALNEGVLELSLTVREDSPWDYRIAPRDAVSGTSFPANLSPDWTAVADKWVDGIDTESLGDGRVSSIDGEEKVSKWGEDAAFTLGSRSEIRTFLGFFAAVKGRWASFTAPLWFRPGTSTTAVPHTTKARLASDTVQLSFESGDVASTRVALWQVPWEINGVAGETPQQSARAFFYKFTYDLPTPEVTRWTNYEKPLTRTGDGTYETARIEHSGFRFGIDLGGGKVDLTTDRFAGNPLLKFIPFSAEARLLLEIREGAPEAPDAATLVWSGEVAEASGNGKRIKARGDVFGSVFERKFPRFLMQQDCNVTLFSSACGVNKATYQVSGTMTSSVGNVITVTCGSTQAANYYARGEVWVGAGSTLERRLILSSAPGTGTQVLTIDRPIAVNGAGGVAAVFWPGCDGQYSTCGSKFSNKLRFRGHPFMPRDNPALKRVATNPDARKK